MSDADKIRQVFDIFTNEEIDEAPTSFKACGKHFFPDKNGEIVKIIFTEKCFRYTATPEGVL